ncbi:unnamed protein product [Cylicocyclus nassatus]|uniref:Uncharacterized protein n=1 Tax=Cylicocyclus nassatus TaxID=53992 RepID=A0AA36H6Y5_CYLNA|nr:unnamed protein product [Cylicocyclus nassatus]
MKMMLKVQIMGSIISAVQVDILFHGSIRTRTKTPTSAAICSYHQQKTFMWLSIRTLFVVLMMTISTAAYFTRQMRQDFENARGLRSSPDFDTQYANNFFRGYGSASQFGPDSGYAEDRYW